MLDDNPQLVIHPVTGDEVLYAPLRAKRSNALIKEPLQLPFSEACPFCPGHEHETPPTLYQWPQPLQPWNLRVVSNRFPVIRTEDKQLLPEHAASSFGRHEIVIESNRHQDDWCSLPTEHLAQILLAISLRITDWSSDLRSQQVQVFKNVGTRAGATLAHPHLQLVAMNYLPRRVIDELHAHEQGEPYPAISLLEEQLLIIERNSSFMTFCPPVSRVPYELCVVSLEPIPFNRLPFEKLLLLALHLQTTFHRLEGVLGKVAHNVIWRLPPLNQDRIPWRIEILPRLTALAGLELGSGIYVNPVRPEMAASQLANVTL